MATGDGKINFEIGLDNDKLRRDAEESKRIIESITQKTQSEGERIDATMKKIGATIAGVFAVEKLKDFASQVAIVRGQFQQFEIAFRTMLGSEEKATALMDQLVKTAATTPFGMTDVVNGAKQLLAFGESADTVNNTLIRLGDIAAGTGAHLGQLTNVYGQIMAAGKMNGGDLLQFVNAGVPIIKSLADTMGVAESSVKELISKGKVGFPEVRKALESLTDEGSKFGGMMEAQSHSITGQISNLEDSIEQMFNEIGKRTEGKISTAIELTGTLIDHWKQIAVAIMGVLSVYGGYKTAVVATYVAEKVAKNGSIAAWLKETVAIKGATGAVTAFNLAIKANPIGFIIGLLTTAATAFALFRDSADEATEEVEKFGKSAGTELNKVNTLTTTLKGLTAGTTTHKKALGELNEVLAEYGLKQLDEKASIEDINQARERAIELIKEEAIERQRANQIEAGAETYNAKIAEARKQLEERLKNSANKNIKDNASSISTIISSTLEENPYLDYYSLELREALTQKLGKMGIDAKEVYAAYEEGMLGAHDILHKYTDAVNNAHKAQAENDEQANKSAEALKAVAEATMTLTEKQDALKAKLQKAGDGVHELYKNITDLVSKYDGKSFDFKINVSEKVPDWMKKMSLEDLQKYAKQFAALGSTSKNGAMIGGKRWSQQELLQRSAQYAQAAEDKQTAEDKKTEYANSTEGKRAAKKAAEETKRLAKEKTKRLEEIEKYKKEVEQAEQQAEFEIRAKKIEAMESGYSKEKDSIELNYDRMVFAIQKKEEEMVKDLGKNKVREWMNDNPKASTTQQYEYLQSLNLSGKDLTEKQQKQLAEFRKAAEEIRNIEIGKISGTQEAINEYLKQYGDYQAQKFAIAQEYADRIRAVERSSDSEEQKEWKIRSIKQEQKNTNDQIEANAIMQRIDWATIFGNIGGIMSNALKPMLEDLKAFTKTSNFKTLGVDQQKQIIEAMKTMRSQIGDTSDLGWQDLANDMQAYQESLQALKTAQEEYTTLQLSLTPSIEKAKADLEKAKASGDTKGIQLASTTLAEFNQQLADASDILTQAKDNVTTSGQQLSQTTESVTQPISEISSFLSSANIGNLGELFKAFDSLKGGVEGLKALNNVAKGIGDAGKAIKSSTTEAASDAVEGASKAVDALSEGLSKAGFIGQIIAAILKILDVLKDGIGPLISSLIETIFNAISGIIENILSGDFFKQILKAIVDGIGNLLNSIIGNLGNLLSFGALSSDAGDWFTKSNAKEVAKTTEKLTKQNEALAHSIDALKASIDKNYGGKAISDYQAAYQAQKATTDNVQAILNAQQSYHNAHHSNASNWNMSQELTDAVNDLLGTALKNNKWSDWGALTADQMEEIRTYLPKAWSEMLAQGDYDKSSYFEDYADEAGKLEELTEQIRENLLGTSFESLRDSFVDTLMDMDASVDDFSDDFTEKMQRAFLQAKISDLFDDQLQEWYKGVTDAMINEEDGSFRELTETELDYYRTMWDDMAQSMIETRDHLASVTGYTGDSSSREGSSKGIATASQESVDELNGRATAIQGHTFSISENTKLLVSVTNDILQSVRNIESNTEDLPTRMAGMESNLKVVKDTVNDLAQRGIKIRN